MKSTFSALLREIPKTLSKWFGRADQKFLRATLRYLSVGLEERRNLLDLKAKQEAQIVINYSRSPILLLDSLCDTHGSDKGGVAGWENPYPWRTHTYTDVFSLLFEPSREQFSLIFECGIGSNNLDVPSNMGSSGVPGASLRVWRDFFPNAQIIGADVDQRVLFEEERISTYQVDQTDAKSIKDMWQRIGLSGFQLMIDDGLHTFQAGKTLFLESIGHLAPNGTYIIEDVEHEDMVDYMDFFDGLGFRASFISLRRPLEGGREVQMGDNQLIVIRKPQEK